MNFTNRLFLLHFLSKCGIASSISDLSVMTSPISGNTRVNISPDPSNQRNIEVILFIYLNFAK